MNYNRVLLGTIDANIMGYTAKPNVSAILAVVRFCMDIGLFYGYYPASKAAKLNPIYELIYE